MTKRLHRIPEQGQIAGVAAGFADYFSVDPTVMRVIFVILAFMTGGTLIFVYILLIVILPVGSESSTENASPLDSVATSRARNWIGGGLIVFGVWHLANFYFPELLRIRWDIIWPLALIFIGATLIMRGRR